MHQVNTKPRSPLSPLNMLLAGVSASDVVWFRRLPPGEQMRQLHASQRGRSLLTTVREHEARKLARSAMPAPA